MAPETDRDGRLGARLLLDSAGLRPKKSAGQNFLADHAAADAIVHRAGVGRQDVVLEIGAGLGALTHPLARAARAVVAVEWDRDLVPLLNRQLETAGLANVRVLRQDILSLDLAPLAAEFGGPLLVAGNLPYNISSQVLAKLVAARSVVSRAVLMFQKELAERVMAPPGSRDYGRVSVLAAYAADIRPLATLNPDRFFPRPRVDSMVLEFTFREPAPAAPRDEALFFAVVRAAFSQRRKTLRNSLASGPFSRGESEAALERAGIDPARRAETLSVAEYVRLADALAAAAAAAPY